jgi:hypothetical protein
VDLWEENDHVVWSCPFENTDALYVSSVQELAAESAAVDVGVESAGGSHCLAVVRNVDVTGAIKLRAGKVS